MSRQPYNMAEWPWLNVITVITVITLSFIVQIVYQICVNGGSYQYAEVEATCPECTGAGSDSSCNKYPDCGVHSIWPECADFNASCNKYECSSRVNGDVWLFLTVSTSAKCLNDSSTYCEVIYDLCDVRHKTHA